MRFPKIIQYRGAIYLLQCQNKSGSAGTHVRRSSPDVDPGWYVTDGEEEIYFPGARTAEEAGQLFVDEFDWGRGHHDPEFGPLGTVLVRVWRQGVDQDGEEVIFDEEEIEFEL